MKNIVIIGACSAIAKEVARIYAKPETNFILWARNQQKLDVVSQDLQARGAQVQTIQADVNQLESYPQWVEQSTSDPIDLVLIAHGTLPEQQACANDPQKNHQEIVTNGVSAVQLMNRFATVLDKQQSGSLAVISSVAGDRGRKSNYTYGAAKAMVSAYAEGLIARFASTPVHVLLVKPGFVDTPMTAEFDKGALWAKPDAVAQSIVKAIEKKKGIIYVPFFWWFIMQIVKNIPGAIFKKLPL